jgi:hypothetical protein
MKKLYLLVSLNVLCIHLHSQNFSWGKAEGKYAYDYGYEVALDNAGNVYVAGKYEENAIFSGTTVNCAGNHDIFIAQYSPAGDLNWIKTAGGALGDYAHCLSTNKTSNVYIAGEIEGAGIPVNFQGSSTNYITKGDNDIFVASYDLLGNLVWAHTEGTYKSEKALGISNDNSGNVVICGYFTDTTKIGSTIIPGAGGHDVFLAKYDQNGNLLWAKQAGGPGRDEALNVECDAAGNIYVCGMHSNGAVFGSSTFPTVNTTSGYYLNTFIAKYAPDGTLIWAKSHGSDYDDVAWSLVLDNAGKIYVAGEFNAYATFDWASLTTTGMANIYVACYDAAGSVQWVTQAGGPIIDRARGIGTDGTNLYITGQFATTATFGSLTAVASDSSDIFIAQLNNSGNFTWVRSVGGVADAYEELGYESGNSVTASSGVAYATGSILNGGTFGSTNVTGYGRTDAFLTKLTTIVGIDENSTINSFHVYPNPGSGIFNIQYDGAQGKKSEVNIYNYLGELIYQINSGSSSIKLDLSKEKKGMYFIQLKSEDSVSLEKIVLQ